MVWKIYENYGEERLSSKPRWDNTLFIKHSHLGKIATLYVYVDDIVVTRDNQEGIMGPESCLAKEFEIMDLGKLQYFLGIEVARSNQGLLILKGSIYKI